MFKISYKQINNKISVGFIKKWIKLGQNVEKLSENWEFSKLRISKLKIDKMSCSVSLEMILYSYITFDQLSPNCIKRE